jgi:hypothetical protein
VDTAAAVANNRNLRMVQMILYDGKTALCANPAFAKKQGKKWHLARVNIE